MRARTERDAEGLGWFEAGPEPALGEAFTFNADAARIWTREFTVWP